jgi:hypothetical protein
VLPGDSWMRSSVPVSPFRMLVVSILIHLSAFVVTAWLSAPLV